MLSVFDPLRELTMASLLFRLLLALACGSVIGYGRSQKNCAAGLRTYMLISLGAALSVLVTMYEYEMLRGPWAEVAARVGEKFDASRLASQAVTGIGFLGAGTIIITRKNSIKGLTTAAGLWATGIIGVALGSGYFEGGFLAALLVIVTEAGLFKLGDSIKSRPDFSVELRYNDKTSLDQVLHYCKDQHMSIRTRDNETPKYVATVRLRGSAKAELLMRSLRKMPGIVTAEMEE